MTFTHEGNKTYFDGLVNFEKMVSKLDLYIKNVKQDICYQPSFNDELISVYNKLYLKSVNCGLNQFI